MNSITIAGQLGRDAELRYLTNGDPVLGFSVADDQGKDKQTIWWNCSLFGKRAGSLAQYLTKGQKVTVIGQVTEREYIDKDGQKRKAQDVRVVDVALQGGQRQDAAPVHEAGLPRPTARPAARPAAGFADPDDDIPFSPTYPRRQSLAI